MTRQKNPPYLTEPQMLKALGHPTRVHALTVLHERSESPKTLAKELDRTVKHVCYHLETLEELGCIELVDTKPVWGGRATEHFYRAIERPWFDREGWKQLGRSGQKGVTAAIMSLINEDIATAITAGTFDEDDNHISRTPLILDAVSYEELLQLLSSTLLTILEIQEAATNRLQPGDTPILTKVNFIQFVSPDPDTAN